MPCDVRLTMGGEPTFVSIDDMEGPEWNIAADGPQKRRAGRHAAPPPGALLRPRRAAALRPGQVVSRRVAAPLGLGLLLAQGRRADLADPELIAADDPDDRRRRLRRSPGLHHSPGASGSRSDRDHVVPGYEDAWYYLWKERRLPINVDPLKSKLENEEERKRLARVFERGLGQVVGYALPIRPVYSDGRRRAGKAAAGSAAGEHVPPARRFADGLPPAAG